MLTECGEYNLLFSPAGPAVATMPSFWTSFTSKSNKSQVHFKTSHSQRILNGLSLAEAFQKENEKVHF